MIVKANLVQILERKIIPAAIEVNGDKIISITPIDEPVEGFILPGFVDAHVHIESSMLVPSEFARIAVTHGTVATVSDPHEIANVLGVEGVNYMIENGNQVPLKFNFGAPSCVPATSFETAGAIVSPEDIDELLSRPEVRYLAEMMNYPGVLFKDPDVHKKLEIAKKHGKPIDGHAPGLRGDKAKQYIDNGISTDHECFTREEAEDKLQYGMKILIREGSAAKNFEALIDLMPKHFERMMFCSDDKHPDDLLLGHINQLVARAVARGIDVFKVLQAACINPVKHYNLDVGLTNVGDLADFILVDNLKDFNVLQTYINGELVADQGKSLVKPVPVHTINNFSTDRKQPRDFQLAATHESLQVIEAIDGELITKKVTAKARIVNGLLEADVSQDVLKMAVVNRYSNQPVALAFIKGIGLQEGAIASCVGHDSHNIVVVGVDDKSICKSVNLIIENRGGISAVGRSAEKVLPLPVAGIMAVDDAETVGREYSELDKFAKELGSSLGAPYMTLSFMALLVIPSLKLSDLGLFDGDSFSFVDLQV